MLLEFTTELCFSQLFSSSAYNWTGTLCLSERRTSSLMTWLLSYSLLIVYVGWAYQTLLSYSFLKCFPSFAPWIVYCYNSSCIQSSKFIKQFRLPFAWKINAFGFLFYQVTRQSKALCVIQVNWICSGFKRQEPYYISCLIRIWPALVFFWTNSSSSFKSRPAKPNYNQSMSRDLFINSTQTIFPQSLVKQW